MQKIYSVMIKGRTLEGRDLKQLLARAVSEKRSLDRRSSLRTGAYGQGPVENISAEYVARSAAML